eukprot:159751-Chlamydomonas_euryale.AAC.2
MKRRVDEQTGNTSRGRKVGPVASTCSPPLCPAGEGAQGAAQTARAAEPTQLERVPPAQCAGNYHSHGASSWQTELHTWAKMEDFKESCTTVCYFIRDHCARVPGVRGGARAGAAARGACLSPVCWCSSQGRLSVACLLLHQLMHNSRVEILAVLLNVQARFAS